jgi:hypothetical protein
MNTHRRLTLIVPVALITLVGIGAHAEDALHSVPADRAPVWADVLMPKAELLGDPGQDLSLRTGAGGVLMPVLDLAPLREEDAFNDGTPGIPLRIGINRALPTGPIGPSNAGQWEDLEDGTRVWTTMIQAPGAQAIRVHFSQFDLPDRAQVVVKGNGGEFSAAARGAGPRGEGSFWAATVPGDVAYVQYQAPSDVAEQPRLEIDQIGHIYRGPLSDDPVARESDGGLRTEFECHEDVNCHSPDTTARDAVGWLLFDSGGGQALCTGALLADADPVTYAGYLLTADHCINTQSEASSLEVVWFWQTLSCDGSLPSFWNRPRSYGATLLAHAAINDFSFMRLDNDPNDGQGFASWNSLPQTPGNVTGIHHPGADYLEAYKRISMGYTRTSGPICSPGTSYFWYVRWTTGITEGGCSGSPLFNSNWQVVGQLLGPCYSAGQEPSCENRPYYNNMYGRFDVTYPSISDWLNQTSQPDDDYEENDTFADAAPIDACSHALLLVDFDDYFAVTAENSGVLTVTAEFDTGDMDLNLGLLTAGGEWITTSYGSTSQEVVSESVAPGTYIVHVVRSGGWGGPYMLDIQPPIFTQHPSAAVVCPGHEATFTVAVDGSPTYQWYMDDNPLTDGGDISGATTSTLHVANVDTNDFGDYWCEAAVGCLHNVSESASITFAQAPSQVGTVNSLTKCEGERATFVAQFNGTPPISYQWEKDTVPIDGATQASYTIQVVTVADAGTYRCRASNACDSVYSNEATLTVNPAPIITDQPDSQCVETGGTAVFTVVVSGTGPFYYKWYKDDVKILQGQGLDTLTIEDAQPDDAGEYRVTVQLISAPDCIPSSDIAVLQVDDCPECLNAVVGDMDGDLDVDLSDFRLFQACFGTGMGLTPGCECANIEDTDYDVDLADFDLWLPTLSGP